MKCPSLLLASLAVLWIPASTSCSGEETQAAPTGQLEPYSCGEVQRIHTLGDIFLASQPSSDDFQHAVDGGIKTVMDLRLPDEDRGFDEPARVEELGMAYHNVAFRAADTLTDEVIDRALGLMRDEATHPMMIHCASANRVGAIWLAHRVLDGGLSWDDALAEAATVGLKNPDFEAKVRDYVERNAR